MKKTKAGKTTKLPRTVDEYLSRVPEPARGALERVRTVVRKTAPPEATEGISYGIPTFKYKGMLASFAAFSDHCSLFPGAGPTLKFDYELKSFERSKGTIRFAPEKPLPITLLKKLVKARIVENERRKGR
ncbi:MAG: DUF1801 domain-containing protein [Candidatus Sulfotelmatobacter sp.]